MGGPAAGVGGGRHARGWAELGAGSNAPPPQSCTATQAHTHCKPRNRGSQMQTQLRPGQHAPTHARMSWPRTRQRHAGVHAARRAVQHVDHLAQVLQAGRCGAGRRGCCRPAGGAMRRAALRSVFNNSVFNTMLPVHFFAPYLLGSPHGGSFAPAASLQPCLPATVPCCGPPAPLACTRSRARCGDSIHSTACPLGFRVTGSSTTWACRRSGAREKPAAYGPTKQQSNSAGCLSGILFQSKVVAGCCRRRRA